MGNPALANLTAREAAPVVGSYICDEYAAGCPDKVSATVNDRPSGHCWHESLTRRLAWQYGEARANRVALGIDAAAELDIAAWNRLGAAQ